jgi:hypothetical protein
MSWLTISGLTGLRGTSAPTTASTSLREGRP